MITKTNTMKKDIWKKLFLCFTALATFSCSQDATDAFQLENESDESIVYKMKLETTWNDYDDAVSTRAAFSWTDGAKVYLHFNDESGKISGTATYELATDTWEVKPDRALTANVMANCEAYHFVNPSSSNSSSVELTSQSVIYFDTEATYLFEEDILSVTAVLSPMTGRVRFKGEESTSFGVKGLSYYSAYSISGNTFASKNMKIDGKVGSDGYSPFYYTCFTDKEERALVFDYISTAAYKRTFGADVLLPGTSGFISVPTSEKHDNWSLVSVANGKEITLPELSVMTYSSVKSSSVYLESSVSDCGNGTLSETGFVCATHSEPTLADTKLACGKSTTFSGRLFSLMPLTQYYVRAYATNEAGTVYGEVHSFTTKDTPQGSKIEVDDFQEESDWD